MTDDSDADLLRRYAAERDEGAFAELVRRYLGLVYHAARRQTGGDAHAAEDVAQTVFTLLARKAPSLTQHTTLAGWLHATTQFAAGRFQRTEHRRLRREHEAHVMRESDSSATAANAEWERLRPIIDEALGNLNDADREAVLLRFFANLPLAEIGAKLNLSENAARMRVERALEKLRSLLGRRGLTSTSAALGVVLADQAAMAAVPSGLAVTVTGTALAGAAAASGAASVAGIIGFMGTSKVVTTCVAVLALAGLGTAIYEQRELSRAESARAALQRERDELRARIGGIEQRAQEAEQRAQAGDARITALQKEIEAARAGSNGARGGAVATASASGQTSPSAMPAVDPMLSDPEYFRLSMQKYRVELGQKFWLLYKKLGLTPEQIAKFEKNRTESQQAQLEVFSAAATQGVATSNPAVLKLFAEAAGGLEKDLQAMLGDAGYRQYAQYNISQSAQEVVSALAGTVYRSDSPLTAAQGERLVEAVIANSRSVPTSPGSKTMVRETDWTAVGVQAQTILNPSQADVFQTFLEGKKLQAQMSALSRAARATAAAKPGS